MNYVWLATWNIVFTLAWSGVHGNHIQCLTKGVSHEQLLK